MFLIIGAQKAGTSSLLNYLSQHPDINGPVIKKELHYFDLNFRRGAKWYLSHFPLRKTKKITFEKSPYYIYHPLVPKRAYEFDPKLKLIALLRDPVKRAYSHFHHEIENGREDRPFRQAVEDELERVDADHLKLMRSEIEYSKSHHRYSYYARGRYIDQLDHWLSLFPRNQFYIETAERFFSEPAVVCQEIFDFLKVNAFEPSTKTRYNPGNYSPMSSSDIEWLSKLYFHSNNELGINYGLDLSDWS